MKNLGNVQRYLGVQFHVFLKGIMIHQHDYAKKILCDAGMQECKPAFIPLPLATSLADKTGTQNFDQQCYCYTTGQLLYLTNTWPDLSYVVGYVSRFMAHLEFAHWQAVIHVLRYLKGTLDFGIVYSRLSSPTHLQGFVKTSSPLQFAKFTDADWAACKSSRRSTGGYMFQIAGGPITWSSKHQSTVSMSTIEAKYRALANGAKEVVYLSRLLQELHLSTLGVSLICSENAILNNLSQAFAPTET